MNDAVQRRQHECPFCGAQAVVRSSKRLSPLYSTGIVECSDIGRCGWRGRFAIEVEGTITPSAKPDGQGVVLQHLPYELPMLVPNRKRLVLTKNPLDPNRDQIPLFSK